LHFVFWLSFCAFGFSLLFACVMLFFVDTENVFTSGPRLRDLAAGERPQERLEMFGASALSDVELLAMLLRSGSHDMDVLAVSRQMIQAAGSLAGLLRWDEQDFRKIKGIGHIKALQLLTVTEVARRVLSQGGEADPLMDAPELVYRYLYPRATGLEVEKFWVLCLNSKNRLIKLVEVSSGTATDSMVHSREVYREAIRCGAVSVICAHNHPSGDPSPSGKDQQTTRSVADAGSLLGIRLLDHVVIGHPAKDPNRLGFFSFHDGGLM
jgi:DNA repair protein RadC